ncbi:type II toxin-antitoxin system PemK/MazF family toxin [Nocardia rhizosphaerihabitans]|uniref:type II toxin-antitoxin system PemK/MazF family toxin n=1 Tax=Nocardia rhizosphaerihabitans TaxID=1691570 RepID=UPI00366C8205
MIRGAIYRIDLGEARRGHEQRGRRFGVVLSRTDWTMVTVVPTSTSAQPSRFRPEIKIDGRATLLLVDQIRSLAVDYLKGDPVAYLTREELSDLDRAVIRYLGLD